jgi:hypothetical protein
MKTSNNIDFNFIIESIDRTDFDASQNAIQKNNQSDDRDKDNYKERD